MRKITEHWADYVRKVLPRDVNEIQVQECRRVFYAGAKAYQKICMAMVADGVSDDDGHDVLADIESELQAFSAMVGTPAERMANAIDLRHAGTEAHDAKH